MKFFGTASLVFGLMVIPRLAGASNTLQLPEQYAVVAGTGALGIQDGRAYQASFLMPEAMAYAPDGYLYILDTAAQRLRVLTPQGQVMTVAGSGVINPSGMWVNGGYRDGIATSAQFNRPMGIALDRQGAVYVADTQNHCVRRIFHGFVSTYAGSPEHRGSTDGPRLAASFESPRALALDVEQNLYVADVVNGNVRRISPAGIVTTLKTGPLVGPTGLGLAQSDHPERLWIADKLGISTLGLPDGSFTRMSAYPQPSDKLPPLNAGMILGRPQALAALGDDEVIYTDATDSSVKYLRGNQYLKYFGPVPSETAMLTGGGPGGTVEGPRWNSPLGIARGSGGDTYVADTGNRRIIRLPPFDRRQALTVETLSDLHFSPGAYRIAVVGSSFVWYTTDFPHSLAGELEQGLMNATNFGGRFRRPEAVYFRLGSFQGEVDLIQNILSSGTVDMVVWEVSQNDGVQFGASPTQWVPSLHALYQKTASTLRENNVALTMLLLPFAISFSPLENVELYNRQAVEMSDYFSTQQAMEKAVYGISPLTVDLYPVFAHEIAKVNHQPLFAPDDLHLSPYGRYLSATALAQYLAGQKPWLNQTGVHR